MSAARTGMFATRHPLRGSFLRNYRDTVDQKLRSGDDNFVAGLDPIEHHIVIAYDLANLQRFLMNYVSALGIGLRHKGEIEASNARDRYHRHHRSLLAAPDDARSNELCVP
jgi:hypothetical protein